MTELDSARSINDQIHAAHTGYSDLLGDEVNGTKATRIASHVSFATAGEEVLSLTVALADPNAGTFHVIACTRSLVTVTTVQSPAYEDPVLSSDIFKAADVEAILLEQAPNVTVDGWDQQPPRWAVRIHDKRIRISGDDKATPTAVRRADEYARALLASFTSSTS